eukprot:gene9490-1730_t
MSDNNLKPFSPTTARECFGIDVTSPDEEFDKLREQKENPEVKVVVKERKKEANEQETGEPENVEESVDDIFVKLALLDNCNNGFLTNSKEFEIAPGKVKKVAETISNLNLSFDCEGVNASTKKMRDDLQEEHPGVYDLSVAVRTNIGWRGGKFAPTNEDYIYIYHPDIYDEDEDDEDQGTTDIIYDIVHFYIRPKEE